jgi:hypothetical protein
MIPLGTLTGDTYHAVTAEEQEVFVDKDAKTKELVANALDAVSDLDNIDTEAVSRIITETAELGLAPIQVEQVMKAISSNGAMSPKAVRAQYAEAKKNVRHVGGDKDQQKRAAQHARNVRDALGIETPADLRMVTIDPIMGHREWKQTIIGEIRTRNVGEKAVLFVYGDDAYKVTHDRSDSHVQLDKLSWEHLQNYIDERVIFVRPTDAGLKSDAIPERVLKEVIAARPHLKKLVGFTALPYYTRAGNLITAHGFSEESGYYLNLTDNFDMSKIPKDPTPEEVIAARDYILKETYGEFPFDDGPDSETGGAGSRAHFLAMMLQPIVRPMISGPTPIFLISKPTAGTGASLLIGTALATSYNLKEAGAASESRNEEETRKSITSAFLSGQPYYWIDNVNNQLAGASLCNLATAGKWEDRELGRNKTVSFPNNMQVILSGNNPRGTYEVMRRCVPIRLDAKRDPRKRKDFRIEDLHDFVATHRQKLVISLLTLVNAWVSAGRPRFRDRKLISFENWGQIMGGIMQVCGMSDGFLCNLHLTQKFADDQTRAWESLFYAWLSAAKPDGKKLHGLGARLTSKQVAEIYVGMEELPDLGFKIVGDEEAPKLAPKISNALSLQTGAPITVTIDDREIDVCVKRTKDPKTATIHWSLEEMAE